MGLPAGRLAIRLDREGGGTLVRLRGARILRDVRRLPALLKLVEPAGFVRIRRNHAVNLRRVREVRRQKDLGD